MQNLALAILLAATGISDASLPVVTNARQIAKPDDHLLLVFNAVTHGKASEIRVAGAHEAEAILFSVTDNGFEPERRPTAQDGHFGLDGVAERIRRHDGDMKIESRPRHGTRIVITLHREEGME